MKVIRGCMYAVVASNVVEPFLKSIEIPLEYTKQRQDRDGSSYHITVSTSMELDVKNLI